MTPEVRRAVEAELLHPDGPRYQAAAEVLGLGWPVMASILRRFAGVVAAKDVTIARLRADGEDLRRRLAALEGGHRPGSTTLPLEKVSSSA